MDLGLEGKVAMVAAASQGLGRATALSLAKEGARLALCARHPEALEETAAEIRAATGAEVLTVATDLTDAEQIATFADRTLAQYGTVHVLVNNAGGPPPGAFEDLPDDAWDAAFTLTLMSAVRLTRAVLPNMRGQKWGRVVNISSFGTKQPINPLLLSNSLRLAVVGWAKTVSNLVAQDNVTINSVGPGWTWTDRVASLLAGRAEAGGKSEAEAEAEITATIPMRRMGRPEELADVVTFLCSERASYVTGTSLMVDGGAAQSYL